VIAAVGLLVLLTLIPGGQVVVANFIGIVSVVAAGCLAIVGTVSVTDKNNSFVKTYVAT
jgi:hypothetical protein